MSATRRGAGGAPRRQPAQRVAAARRRLLVRAATRVPSAPRPGESGARVRGGRDGQERIPIGREPSRRRLPSADMGRDLAEAPEPGAPHFT